MALPCTDAPNMGRSNHGTDRLPGIRRPRPCIRPLPPCLGCDGRLSTRPSGPGAGRIVLPGRVLIANLWSLDHERLVQHPTQRQPQHCSYPPAV